MGQIEQITNFEVAEKIRFYGSIVGTEGIDQQIKDICNGNILKLLQAVQGDVDKLTASKAGLIT